MFSFFELLTGTVIEPHLEFRTDLKLDLYSLIDSNLFITVSHKSGIDLYIPSLSTNYKGDQKLKIFRFTEDFRFRITLEVAKSIPSKRVSLYSASNQFFNHLNQLLTLEPSFKFKPPANMESQTIKEILSESSFKSGYLQVSSWGTERRANNPLFEEIFITSPEELDLIDFTNIGDIDRIALFDTEKNSELVQLQTTKRADSNNPQLSLFNSDDPSGTSLSFEREKHSNDTKDKNEENILLDMLISYFSKNISQSAGEDILKNTTGKTIPDILRYINGYIRRIKFNQKEHREKIKALVADFYTEHYQHISEQNLTEAIEEFYTNN